MSKHPVVWGLDIGHSSVKAVKLSRTGGTVTVMAYAIAPIEVSAEGDRDEAVVKALQQLAQDEDFGGIPVIASLSGRQIFSRTINMPVLNAKKVERMVELEARQLIPGNFEEVEWGYHLSPAPDGASNDVALFAARREIIEELIRKCKRAGLNLVAVSVTSLALYNFVSYDQDFPLDETVIILDIGAENTDLVAYQGQQTLWMRTLNLSGNDITNVFMKKFRVSFEEAETLKRQIGDSRQAEKILKVLEGTLSELTSEVQRSLGYYKSQNPAVKFENIVISGNTFRLPSLPEYLAERMRYTVNILEDLDKIQVAPGIDRVDFLRELQSLGVALGLGLQGLGMGKANVNLLPNTLKLQRALRTKRWAAIAAIVVLGATFGVRTVVLSQLIKNNGNMANLIKKEQDANSAEIKTAKATLDQVGPIAVRLKSYGLYGYRGTVHAVLANVLDTVQGFVQAEKDPINLKADAKPPEAGGEPPLQQMYLERIDFQAPENTKIFAADPFNPFPVERTVLITMRFPIMSSDLNAEKALAKVFSEKLKALTTPNFMMDPNSPIHPNSTLFSDVQQGHQGKTSSSYWYIYKDNVDAEGKPKPIHLKRDIPVWEVTFECKIGNPPPIVASVPAVAAPKGVHK